MDKELLSNRVIREIIAMIAGGAYEDGHRLPAERSLCTELGVSRGTLRKALESMEELGLIEIKHNSGIYVNNLSNAKVPDKFLPPDFGKVALDDILVARKAIELSAIELACDRITSRQLKHLGSLLAQMEKSIPNLAQFLKVDMQFHQALVQASGNIVLIKAFEAIYEYHKFSSVFTSQHEGEEQIAFDTHVKLFNAIQKHDSKAARRIMTNHLNYMKRYVQVESHKKVIYEL